MLIHPFLGLFTSLAEVSANGKLEWIELVPQGTWMTSNVILGSRCQVTWRCATLAGLTPIGKENFGWLNPHCKRKLWLKCLHRKEKLVRYLWLQYHRLSQIDKVQQKQISLSTLIKIPPHISHWRCSMCQYRPRQLTDAAWELSIVEPSHTDVGCVVHLASETKLVKIIFDS